MAKRTLNAVPETLEVEVIAIDGAPPPSAQPPQKEPSRRPAGMPDWRAWGARLMKLDRRWWPLWVVLGLVLLSVVVVVALGVLAAVILGSVLRSIVRIFTGGSSPPRFFTVVRRP